MTFLHHIHVLWGLLGYFSGLEWIWGTGIVSFKGDWQLFFFKNIHNYLWLHVLSHNKYVLYKLLPSHSRYQQEWIGYLLSVEGESREQRLAEFTIQWMNSRTPYPSPFPFSGRLSVSMLGFSDQTDMLAHQILPQTPESVVREASESWVPKGNHFEVSLLSPAFSCLARPDSPGLRLFKAYLFLLQSPELALGQCVCAGEGRGGGMLLASGSWQLQNWGSHLENRHSHIIFSVSIRHPPSVCHKVRGAPTSARRSKSFSLFLCLIVSPG